jgi:DNA ligase (NAD+)
MKTIQTEIEVLLRTLNEANTQYYMGKPTNLSDQEFDLKLKELEKLEALHPQFKYSNSPTLRVGSDLSNTFAKVLHKIPMLSISNSYNAEELLAFDTQIKGLLETNPNYVAEMKIDGVSLSIHYKEGIFDYAVTRGDGVQGDDVTANAKQILDIPLEIPDKSAHIEIRGEVYMSHTDFKNLNKKLLADGKDPMQNPRNCASGTLKMKNPKDVRNRKLRFYAFGLYGDSHVESHSQNLNTLENWCFPVQERLVSLDIENILIFCKTWEKQKTVLDFDIDGMVIKVNSLAQQQVLGNTAKSPKWVTAWKFTAERALSKIISIDIQIGRTGVLTPVANLEAVWLNGTKVKRATLHNFDEIERLDIRLKDQVWIEKGGEIIPKVVEVVKSNDRASIYSPPLECPSCSASLTQKENEIALLCENLLCPDQIQRYLEHFVSRSAMNIDHIGPSLIQQLIKKHKVKSPADLYNLTLDSLLTLDRMAEKSANNILQAMADSKSNSLEMLLHGLGIKHIGKTAAKNLARKFKTLQKLQTATSEDLESVPDIGYKMAESLLEYFSNGQNILLIDNLIELGICCEYNQPADQSSLLDGALFVITGTLPTLKRNEAQVLIEKNGGKVSTSVSKKTNYLLAGEAAGSKLVKAENLGVQILSEDDFYLLLET